MGKMYGAAGSLDPDDEDNMAGPKEDMGNKTGRRQRQNVFLISGWCLFLWGVFVFNYWCTAYWLQKYYDPLCWIPMVVCYLIAGGILGGWSGAAAKGASNANTLLFIGSSIGLMTTLGGVYGNQAYIKYWHDFYTFEGLESYVNIMPNQDNAIAFQDAGQVYFKEGSHIDISRGVCFKNFYRYCLAPIIREVLEDTAEQRAGGSGLQVPKTGSVDWFAVGVNCCEETGEGFNCGETGNNLARTGLRQMNDQERPFFYMAAQAWSQKYLIPSKNPIFFTWVQDPLGVIGGKGVAGLTHWYMGLAGGLMLAVAMTVFGVAVLKFGVVYR